MAHYHQAKFQISAAKLSQLPTDEGIEVAFAGRSNAGKSSAINVLTQQKSLARTSKTPGRTQLINLFSLDEQRRIVDLPGYGFAKVPQSVKQRWQQTLGAYLQQRECLQGLVVLMDSRHPLKDIDQMLIHWCQECQLPCHILLTKADKLSRNQQQQALQQVKKALKGQELVSVQLFSALKKQGLTTLVECLDQWYQWAS